MNFSPLPPLKQVHAVEPGRARDLMPNLPAGEDVVLAIMRSVASGTVFPEDALLSVRCWLNCGELQVVAAELTHQEQFA